jgi:hypothetical protein
MSQPDNIIDVTDAVQRVLASVPLIDGGETDPVEIAKQEYLADEDALWNDTTAGKDTIRQHRRVRELPQHRLMIMLKVQGLSNQEIGERLDVLPSTVGDVLRQPWARARIVHELQTAGRDALHTLLESTAVDSVMTLVSLRDDPKTPQAVKKAACDSLLDRVLGKATQPIVQTNVNIQSTSLVELDAQIKQIESQELALQGTSGKGQN